MKLNQDDIKAIIPHREPFLLIDEAEIIEEGKSAAARWTLTGDEYFFKGHFPGTPVLPGVLMLESIAQCGALVILGLPENRGKIAYFAGADNVKWKRKVVPGETLELRCELVKFRFGMAVAAGTATVNGEVCCTAEIKCMVQ